MKSCEKKVTRDPDSSFNDSKKRLKIRKTKPGVKELAKLIDDGEDI